MANVLDFIFLYLAIGITFTGLLIYNFEKYLPTFVIKGYKYGSFAYRGSGANFIEAIEISKSYYRHFYLLSSILSLLTLTYMIFVYLLQLSVNYYVQIILLSILQKNQPSVCVVAALSAALLITIQCMRRLYETYCLQVFAKSSKMNLSHYLAGIIHYVGCIIAIVGESPLFCGSQNRSEMIWTNTQTNLFIIPCILIFMWAWFEQYQSNVILANLRKDKKTGVVITEDHNIPHGRWFEKVSSPHRMCEIIIYTVLLVLIPTQTFFCIYLWVLANQTQTSLQAQQWYQKTFKHYPKNRYALIPGVF